MNTKAISIERAAWDRAGGFSLQVGICLTPDTTTCRGFPSGLPKAEHSALRFSRSKGKKAGKA